ncbi:MAG: lipopolysaccharide biosynthesis protein [Alphaproteobacteria bacterium]|nr:lipopolysaccharide biosynthesis protein [Alphaproteobacteria bacterium]
MGTIGDIRDILRGALASLGGFGGRMLARLVLMLVAGHLYGAASLGLLGQVAALTEILAAAATIGLKRALLDLLSAKDANTRTESIIKEALLSALLIALLASLALAILWPMLFPAHPMPGLLALAIPAIVIAEVGGAAIRFKRIIRWEVIARCVLEPWGFLLAALGFFAAGLDETGLITAYAFSAVMAAAGILSGLSRAYGLKKVVRAPLQMKALYQIPRHSLPAGITDMGIMMFRRMDILILSAVAGHDTTGIYYMAQQIVTIPHKIHQLFEPMTTPVIARLHHAFKPDTIAAKLSGLCRWTFTLQLALTVPFAVYGGQLMGLFGDQFTEGANVLAFLLMAELFDGSFALTETALLFARPGLPPRMVLVALILEVAAIAGLAYIWQAEGAAAGFMLAMMALAVMRLIMLKRHLGIKVLGRAFLPPLGIGITIGAILLSLTPIPLPDGLFGFVILIAVATFLLLIRFWGLTQTDRDLFRQLRAGSS